MHFVKYQALGNDYIVVQPADVPDLTPQHIRRICDRHYGVGADGILYGGLPSLQCDVGLRIFNPDGSETEKSGNGLRIFARFLWDAGIVGDQAFTVETLGGVVTCVVAPDGKRVHVQMGQVTFDSRVIPVLGAPRDVLNETIVLGETAWRFCAASVGNPHCVVVCDGMPTLAEIQHYGALLETHPIFPNRTNVQFMTVQNRQNIAIEIWERGAGYTLASGSSSTAAAAVAHRLGLCNETIHVHMPGGTIDITLDATFHATMSGAVSKVCSGTFAAEMWH